MGLFRYTAPGTRPGDLGSCCPELAETVAQPDSVVRLAPNGIVQLATRVGRGDFGSHNRELPLYFCPFCGCELQSRRTVADLT
jgi:hypothetical protein